MKPQRYADIKDAMAGIFQKFGQGTVILEIVHDPDDHEGGCGCMECQHGARFDREFFDDEDEERVDDPDSGEYQSATTGDRSDEVEAVADDVRRTSQEQGVQAHKLQNIAAALKSLGG